MFFVFLRFAAGMQHGDSAERGARWKCFRSKGDGAAVPMAWVEGSDLPRQSLFISLQAALPSAPPRWISPCNSFPLPEYIRPVKFIRRNRRHPRAADRQAPRRRRSASSSRERADIRHCVSQLRNALLGCDIGSAANDSRKRRLLVQQPIMDR